jgi:hypothetical protein
MALFPIAIIAVLIGMYLIRRGSTLTRDCRWREDRGHAGTARHFRCAACGAEIDCPPGKEPRVCLRPPRANNA